jgi:pyruvate dehydrogenase E2 component (dihydrolipoamide acetyltransferase)
MTTVLHPYRLPELGEGLHEAELVKWHVQPGDSIQEDQHLLDVQNDKAVVELNAPIAGVVTEIKVAEGKIAVVGDTLAIIEAQGDVPRASEAPEARDVPGASEISAPPTMTTEHETEAPAVLATPSVRKFAQTNGTDLTRTRGTGKNGRITREDVLAMREGAPAFRENASAPLEGAAALRDATTAQSMDAAASASLAPPALSAFLAPTAPAAPAEHRVPFRGIRKAIAQAMVKSVYTAPHVTLMDEADVSELVNLRERLKPIAEARGVKLTYIPFIAKALISAVRQYPILNATLDETRDEIVYQPSVHLGIATDTEQGLIVPVLFNADRKSMLQLAEEIHQLATRGREGKLISQEMRGSSITLTNIGSAGGMFFTPILNYPEAAILGIGRITEKPIVRFGELAIGQVMTMSMSFDHRLIDGVTAQQALNHMKKLLSNPDLLLVEV